MNRMIIVVVAVCLAALSGCNTVEGMGKDIKKAGESIEKSAK